MNSIDRVGWTTKQKKITIIRSNNNNNNNNKHQHGIMNNSKSEDTSQHINGT